MRKIRNIEAFSANISTVISFLLFSWVSTTAYADFIQSKKLEDSKVINSIYNFRSIIYTPSTEEKKHKNFAISKYMAEGQEATEEHVFYLVVYKISKTINFLAQNEIVYSTSDAQKLLDLFDKETKKKKLIWIIFTGSTPWHIGTMIKSKELKQCLHKICISGNIVLEHISLKQYDRLVGSDRRCLCIYTIRLRKLSSLWRNFMFDKVEGSNLVLYNPLVSHGIFDINKNQFIFFMARVFINNCYKFNSAYIVTNALIESIDMDVEERKIVKEILLYVHPIYNCILEYLASLPKNSSNIFHKYDENCRQPQALSSAEEESIPAKLTQIYFIFSNSSYRINDFFPFKTILDISHNQNHGIFIKKIDKKTIICNITKYTPKNHVYLSFNFVRELNNYCLDYLFSQPELLILIRDASYNWVYNVLKESLAKSLCYFSGLPQIQELAAATSCYENVIIVDERLNSICPETIILGMIYYITNNIVVMKSAIQSNIFTCSELPTFVDILFSNNEIKGEIIFKVDEAEENIFLEKPQLESTIQDEIGESYLEEKAISDCPSNEVFVTNSEHMDVTYDHTQEGDSSTICADNMPPTHLLIQHMSEQIRCAPSVSRQYETNQCWPSDLEEMHLDAISNRSIDIGSEYRDFTSEDCEDIEVYTHTPRQYNSAN
ncbi:hypothetical protein NEFER03_2241 [Nematocida sp. LUAm3]|nr:hypothetical protein NEFER03_2241 [Nematocida sp. LUAm3]KAI5176473.1 hypothetical protein NEFER02_2221 [Nematocida sp. LUAm2]KAI5179360.1 hypothetical protein NEFER01_2198 [Nematocida sp. LUAm1]